MAMRNDVVTITGNIGSEPTYNTTRNGDAVVNFRVGSSKGYWNRATGAWVDEGTSWYAVSAFRALAEHARASLHRGDPVVVTGALKIREWENDTRKGISADIVAEAIGHDLNQGTSAFVRRARPAANADRPQPEEEVPQEVDAQVDPQADVVSEEHLAAWGEHGLRAPDIGDADAHATRPDQQEPAMA
ncbi:single-stranded DNA-binding protein [Microbacterium esteraromaticum]|uniref:single-stranded DNA-binding protein n=1 Tax=Microbacterium esteraromaticum TaxID=57043 RepID=UPI001C94A8F1|nr:single-stranded DNA-binding protein [Microbacterium esteraromaticum]MBY6061106.1 single-stranded DNA-binding protein [Microbacterium esteraromaticum]